LETALMVATLVLVAATAPMSNSLIHRRRLKPSIGKR
jgi:hypothetical protein